MFRPTIIVATLFTMLCSLAIVDVAEACPMCKAATEADANLPRAYMYSIIFMLAVPGTIFTSFGIGLYRLNKKENVSLEIAEQFSQNKPNNR